MVKKGNERILKLHSEKKGTETVPLGYYCFGLNMSGSFALFADVKKSAPRGTVLQKKVRNGALFKKRVLFWYPFSKGVLFRSKKKGRKQYPSGGTILVPLGVLFFLNNHVYETVPIRFVGHQNSTPKGTILWTAK